MQIIAHRGDNEIYPEQTEIAYVAALEAGADGVECDIRLTADRQLVCIHDPVVNRVSDGSGRVSTLTLAQLRELNFGTDEYPQQVLTFDRFLELVSAFDDRHIFIETKHPTRHGLAVEKHAEQALRRFGLQRSPYTHIISFNPSSLQKMRLVNRGIDRTLLRRPRWPWIQQFGSPTSRGVALAAAKLREGLLDAAGYVFTVNELDDVDWCQQRGVEYLATDRAATVLAHLGR